MKNVVVVMALSLPLLADIRVKSMITAAGSTTESTVYTKGDRQRLEYGADATLIQQCDRKRLLQLDTATNTFQTIETTAPPPVDPQQVKGGPVSVKTILTDTGETKMMFGYKTRHIKSVVTRTPSVEACDKTTSTVETDGWYIDLPAATLACTLEPAAPTASSCQDQIKPELQGKAKLGYPLAYTIISKIGDAKPETISMQVLEIEVKDLSEALFDTPQGWIDAKARKAGITRIAVAPVNDKTGAGGPAYTQRIFKDLGLAKVETVQINAGTQPEQLARARASEADFVLVAEVAEVKKPEPKAAAGSGAKRLGGMLSKATNLVNPKEAWEARIDYRLLSPADGAVLFTSSASGKTGGNTFNVRGALSLATTVGTMMMLGPMGANMMRGNLGNTLAQMNGSGGLFANGAMGPGAMSGMNPAAGAVGPSLSGMRMLAFAQSANATPAPAGNPTGESEQSKAVDSAIGEMLKGVLAQTKK